MPADHPEFYAALTAALSDRLAVIADHKLRERNPAAHLSRLAEVSHRILQLQTELPADASPRLIHFLEACSYDKALALLQSSH